MAIKTKIKFILNKCDVEIDVDPCMRCLDVIRNLLNQTGTKEGCGIGECGACTIIINGNTINSCIMPAGQMNGTDITTIEGLCDDPVAKVIEQSFIDEGAVQCGFCTPGMILSAYALLLKNNSPAREDIKLALSGNLCRCTGYITIINAVEKAANKINKLKLLSN